MSDLQERWAHILRETAGEGTLNEYLDDVLAEDEKKGLWHNIHKRRKQGKRPKRPGEEGYPETLDIEEADDASADLEEDAAWGRGASRNQMSRAGTGGDPLRGRDSSAYDDIDDDEKTVGQDDDPLEEALALTFGRIDEDEAARKRRVSAVNTIRGQLEHVWQMLGKAETKLGSAKFKADEVDFTKIEATIKKLIDNIQEVMARIESTREKVSL